MPITVAERLKARVCGRSLPAIAGSNPAGSMDVCVVCVVDSGDKAKTGTLQTKKQVRIKYKDRTRE
jgi:hypothetical protein